MSFEETTRYPLVNGHSDGFSKIKYTFLFIFGLLSSVNSLEEEVLEGGKRVLIHCINVTKLNEQEVKHGTFSGNSSVDLSKGVNVLLSLFGNSYLSGNFVRSFLGLFEGLDEFGVLKNSGGFGSSKLIQQVLLQVGKSNLELILLFSNLLFGLFEIGLLNSDNHCKKLIFKTSLSDNEVNDGTLGSNLGFVMRIEHLGLQVELESGGDFDILGTDSDDVGSTLLDVLSTKERIKKWVNILTNGVNHENLTVLDSHLDLLGPSSHRELHDLHLSTFSTSDPLLTLELRINEKRPSGAFTNNRGILLGNSISLETLLGPLSNIGGVSKYVKRINTLGDWESSLGDIL